MQGNGSGTGEQIIQELRKKVEQQAQRKSEKLKAEAASSLASNADSSTQDRLQATNIFMHLKKPEQTNLFGGQRKSINLFQMKPQSSTVLQNGALQGAKNIFISSQKPSVQDEDQKEEDSRNDDGEIPQQSQNIFKTEPDIKIMKFQYKNQLTKLIEIPLKKFKNGTSLAKQNVYASLEKLPNQPSTLYLLIRSNTTKLLVYQGIMIKNISKLQNFMGKTDNLKFDVLNKRQTSSSQREGSETKMTREVVKLQFESSQDSQKFRVEAENYFKFRNE